MADGVSGHPGGGNGRGTAGADPLDVVRRALESGAEGGGALRTPAEREAVREALAALLARVGRARSLAGGLAAVELSPEVSSLTVHLGLAVTDGVRA
ncbi:MAG: hypothetical protein L0216_11905 [Planctomycetales bacterium]|nr:hypothetical protein [Planctomycetales bacterium]